MLNCSLPRGSKTEITSIVYLSPFFFLFLTAHGLKNLDGDIPNCPSFDCGDGVIIGYPFWVSDPAANDTTSFCGYRDFEITCKGTRPSFKTSTNNYTVKSIDTYNHTLSLIDTDVIGQDCPRARHNVSLGILPNNYSVGYADSVKYLVFFFNCSLDPTVEPPLPKESNISCLHNISGTSYVFLSEQPYPPAEYMYLSHNCSGGSIVSPVLGGSLGDSDVATTFGKAMNGGFELTWQEPKMEECRSCEKREGHCGYRQPPGEGLIFQCFCQDGLPYDTACGVSSGNKRLGLKIGLAAVVGAAIFSALSLVLLFFAIRRCEYCGLPRTSDDDTCDTKSVEAFLVSNGFLAVKRYRFLEVKKITANFREKLGQGGFGTVYKGRLEDGTLVAVKILKDSKGSSGEEFINEVASIGRTNHVNVVSLLGFCVQGSKRALIYEFMANGSLDKLLFVDDPTNSTTPVVLLDWQKLHEIALGIARGLEYLHKGCNTRIVHLDIKPHNILLDDDLRPKISDFGLAKFCKPKESVVSTICARGTIGYIAPEVFSRNFGVVSGKSDVYSYGMMLLEMAGRRRNVKTREIQNTSEIYFPHWIYQHLDECYGLQTCADSVENEIARKMILIGLWCIQTNPSSRPSTTRVVEMLEGNVQDLQIPPKPYICSPERSRCNSNVDSLPTFST